MLAVSISKAFVVRVIRRILWNYIYSVDDIVLKRHKVFKTIKYEFLKNEWITAKYEQRVTSDFAANNIILPKHMLTINIFNTKFINIDITSPKNSKLLLLSEVQNIGYDTFHLFIAYTIRKIYCRSRKFIRD